MNFLEHPSLKIKLKEFLEFQDKSDTTELFTRNNYSVDT